MKNGMSKWNSEKKAVLEAAQQMAQKGLVVGTSGNMSMRLGEHNGRELLAITPNACLCNLPQFPLNYKKHTSHFVTGIHILIIA